MITNENNKYNYAILVSVATLIGVVIISFFVIKPLYVKEKNTRTEANAKQLRYASLEEKKKNLTALMGEKDKLEEEAKIMKNALPTDKEIGRLFIQLNDLVVASGGSLMSVTEMDSGGNYTGGGVVTGLEDVQKYTYNLPVTLNSYENFKRFLGYSDNALRLFGINSIEIVANEAGNLNATITAETYTRK